MLWSPMYMWARALLSALIHRSAWKGNSPKLALTIYIDATGPMGLRMPLGLTIHPAAQQAHQDVED